MEKDTKNFFQITEAAHACGVSRSTLMRMEEKGLLTPAYISPESGGGTTTTIMSPAYCRSRSSSPWD